MKYELKRSMRSRTMRLAVYPDARVVVTAPYFFGIASVERFVLKHSRWIGKRIALARGRSVVRIERKNILALKKRALALASARCAHFASVYGLTYAKISIRAQKTRWGSCSRAGNLSFNYKIASLPPALVDYVIVHELCHRAHFNHSKDFWKLVAQAVPDHRSIRAQLKNTAIVFD